MQRSPQRPAFVDNEFLQVIAVLAIWLAASIPIYARVVERFAQPGKSVGPAQQLQALGIAAVGGAVGLIVTVAVSGGLIWAGEQVWKRLRK